MDLGLLTRILWRQRLVVLLGLVVAIASAVLSAYRVNDSKLVERTIPQYESTMRVLITTLPTYQSEVVRSTQNGQQVVQGMSPAQLAGMYSYVILSDQILDKVRAQIPVPQDDYEIDAYRRTAPPGVEQSAIPSGDNSLPIVEVKAIASTPQLAEQIATTTVQTFDQSITDQQDAANIPAEQRISVTTLGAASAADPVGKGPLLLQAVVFAGIMCLFLALAFGRHNAQSARRARNLLEVPPLQPSSPEAVDQTAQAAALARSFSHDDLPTNALESGSGVGSKSGVERKSDLLQRAADVKHDVEHDVEHIGFSQLGSSGQEIDLRTPGEASDEAVTEAVGVGARRRRRWLHRK